MPTRRTTLPFPVRPSLWRPALLGSLLITAAAQAQTAPTPSDVAQQPADSAGLSRNDKVVKLTPFETQTSKDTSYGALNTNSLTSFNAELNKLPITDDIMTKQFMDDVAATSIDQLISTYSVGGGQSAVGTDGGATTMPGDRPLSNSGNGGPTTRGLTGGGTRINGFQKGGLGELFDVERAEVIQGPQGLLYGAGGSGGVINATLNRAQFGVTEGNTKFMIDQYGTKLATLDYNFGTDKFAIRADFEDGTYKFNRLFLGGPVYGSYGQIAYQLFNNTVIRLSYENTDKRNTRNNKVVFNAPATAALGHPTADPRSGIPLRVLVALGEAGDLDNGHVNYGTMDSFEGDDGYERLLDQNYQLSIDTKEFSWLSTQVAAMWDQQYIDNFSLSNSGLTPPGYSSNNTTQWALIGFPNTEGVQMNRRMAGRFSGVIDFKFLNDHAHNQTLFGADYWSLKNTNLGSQYFQADGNFNPIINPATLNSNSLGRTAGAAWNILLPNGPVESPAGIVAFQDRYTNPVTGVNYVRQDQNYIHAVAPTALNPDGYAGGVGDWDERAHSGGLYFADFVDWFDGKLTTLGGLRWENERIERRGPAQGPAEFLINDKPLSANAGINYELLPWLRPYVSYSTSENVPNVLNFDPAGNPVKNPYGHAVEAGLKFSTADGRISGAFSIFDGTNHNDQYQVLPAVFDATNPPGANGRAAPSSVWATVNREAKGGTLELTAVPVPNWRSRLALADIQSVTESTRVYNQLYNDQFFTDGQGDVLYANGAQFLVPSGGAGTATPMIPLTVAMLNGTDPNGNKNYIATLDPDSGRITNQSAVFPNGTTNVANGSVFTGRTGLPISAIQLNFTDPNGHHGVIPVVYSGEGSPNYSRYQITWTNTYDFTHGFLKGFSIGGTYIGRFRTIGYYYDQTVFNSAGKATGIARLPFYLPTQNTISPMISYHFKWGRFAYLTQLNVTNVLNTYHWVVFPNPVSGAYNYDAIYSQQPRLLQWTNKIYF